VPELSARSISRTVGPMDACVLVVDDDNGVRDLVARMGERMGLQMELSADGHEALTRFRATPEGFDVVLLDLSMPELSGEEVCAGIRAHRPLIPVVFMSGHSTPDVLQRTEEVGCVLTLAKPFSMAEFRSVIVEAIGGAPPRGGHRQLAGSRVSRARCAHPPHLLPSLGSKLVRFHGRPERDDVGCADESGPPG